MKPLKTKRKSQNITFDIREGLFITFAAYYCSSYPVMQ